MNHPASLPPATVAGPHTDVSHEKTIIKDREFIRDGPGGHTKEHTMEEEIERDVVNHPGSGQAGKSTSLLAKQTTVSDSATELEPNVEPENIPSKAQAPSHASTASNGKINPRTGKPLSIPAPLSLTPRDMSPITSPHVQEPQLIREEHEEVSR